MNPALLSIFTIATILIYAKFSSGSDTRSMMHPSQTNTDEIEVAVIGSLMIDIVSYAPSLPVRGQTLLGTAFEKNFGGKGANQAVQCARLDCKVAMCGKLGNDAYGDEYKLALERENVNTKYLLRSESTTHASGIAAINVAESDGANTIIIIPGANLHYSCPDIDSLASLIKNVNVVVCQNEVPFATTKRALQLAREYNTVSILNPAPADSKDHDSLIELIKLADIVCPNEVELSILTSLPTTTDDEIVSAAQTLLSYGCQAITVTLGGRGAYICYKDHNSESIVSYFLSTTKVNVVDTVGAGDSFIGTLATNLARGSSLREAATKALYCASQSVTRKGSQKSYSYLHDVDQMFQPPRTKIGKLERSKLLPLIFK